MIQFDKIEFTCNKCTRKQTVKKVIMDEEKLTVKLVCGGDCMGVKDNFYYFFNPLTHRLSKIPVRKAK